MMFLLRLVCAITGGRVKKGAWDHVIAQSEGCTYYAVEYGPYKSLITLRGLNCI